MARFKDKKLQKVFDLYSKIPPTKRGDALLAKYYFNGLEYPNKENLKPERGTFAYAAWAAGHALAKQREKTQNE
jgi:hypothetical protein